MGLFIVMGTVVSFEQALCLEEVEFLGFGTRVVLEEAAEYPGSNVSFAIDC